MVSKANWICQKCGQGFTRCTSGKRHNANLHSNMALIVESSDYYIGITTGKYKPPEAPPALFKRTKSFNTNFVDIKIRNETIDHCTSNRNNYDFNNNDHPNFKDNLFCNHFIPDNAALIDTIIEKYEEKLSRFLTSEEVNKIIYEFMIIPLSTIIDSKESFYNHIKRVDNLVAYLRILNRGGVNGVNVK